MTAKDVSKGYAKPGFSQRVPDLVVRPRAPSIHTPPPTPGEPPGHVTGENSFHLHALLCGHWQPPEVRAHHAARPLSIQARQRSLLLSSTPKNSPLPHLCVSHAARTSHAPKSHLTHGGLRPESAAGSTCTLHSSSHSACSILRTKYKSTQPHAYTSASYISASNGADAIGKQTPPCHPGRRPALRTENDVAREQGNSGRDAR